uniref:CAAX prenyl protease 2/Lysostaphin resistance protein A-like domain-containing protein n=1 Tax=Chromera velia CCMP2878 TaxID=1169474 RepID=A0A0G4I1S3_9ALVE|eukprot:Cvel_1674.t1-p1 / transcript=Cvel_1674.t1 / gene=Cvel_1674 / organism=Chromera_velia_CCMP2878 / gene_product=hypothetical protein / transcript_product=hypothetical protein / location=Cvel_scaffold60:60030-63536(-) / protein_length=450 / sequence_SO=supercontig / SO=protein_coding / is_pseudo=false
MRRQRSLFSSRGPVCFCPLLLVVLFCLLSPSCAFLQKSPLTPLSSKTFGHVPFRSLHPRLLSDAPLSSLSARTKKKVVDEETNTDLGLGTTTPPVLNNWSEKAKKDPFWRDRLPAWMFPAITTTLPPPVQAAIALSFYALNLLVLSKLQVGFPCQLIPNQVGLFRAFQLDSLVGMGVLGLVAYVRRRAGVAILPSTYPPQVPWKRAEAEERNKQMVLMVMLGVAYFLSSYVAIFFEGILYAAAAAGAPISVAMHRALQVVVSHFLWVGIGVYLIGSQLRPWFPPRGKGYRLRWDANWVWWVVGGYFVSCMAYNFIGPLNEIVSESLFPSQFEDAASETVVAKMINPEENDVLSMAVGAVAPCVSAPMWEEVLYRGFALSFFGSFLPTSIAVPITSLLFSAHHLQISAGVPLALLGFAWAILYLHSGNLLVPVLIHAMWNSRVFLGSFLGV